MTTLIVGASGATGRLVVEELLKRGQAVRIIVRSVERLPETVKGHANVSVIEENILDMSDDDLVHLVQGCDAVVSCLGHNLTFQGLFGAPRRLVTDATRRLCDAIRASKPMEPVKFVLMSSNGVRNRDLEEPISLAQRCVIGLLRLVLPPHVDNEKAADYLRMKVGQSDPQIEWAAVRPDGLVDEADVTDYTIFLSPIRSAIFDSGTTSRINVAHFIVKLIDADEGWSTWKGKMPVIYNSV